MNKKKVDSLIHHLEAIDKNKESGRYSQKQHDLLSRRAIEKRINK